MKCPCAAIVSFLMHPHVAAHQGEWHFVVVKWSTEVGVCRHIRGGIRLLNEIDGGFGLW